MSAFRPVRVEDEAVALRAQAELEPEGFSFLLGHRRGEAWTDYVGRLGRQRHGLDLAPETVPAAFLLVAAEGEVVGRVSVRFALTRWLWERGGHIGYGIRPAFRGRGYARAALCQALVVARAEGVDQVLLVRDEQNGASAALVLGAGGVEGDGFRDEHGRLHRRFWID